MLERLVQKADFERLLTSRSRLRSAHFALHHVAERPAAPKKPVAQQLTTDLSTDAAMGLPVFVDNLDGQHWLGLVVPKRHAKRAVTRSLIKRQMRQVFADQASQLPGGLWLLRLSQGFPVAEFVSARSAALNVAVRRELEQLLAHPRLRLPPVVAARGATG